MDSNKTKQNVFLSLLKKFLRENFLGPLSHLNSPSPYNFWVMDSKNHELDKFAYL